MVESVFLSILANEPFGEEAFVVRGIDFDRQGLGMEVQEMVEMLEVADKNPLVEVSLLMWLPIVPNKAGKKLYEFNIYKIRLTHRQK